MSHEEHEMLPTAYARQFDLTLMAAMPVDELQARLDAFLTELARSLQLGGQRLIGHIKGLVETEAEGQLFFSVTSLKDRASFKGKLNGEIRSARLPINVIVYGVEEEVVERAVQEGLRKHLGAGACMDPPRA